MIAILLLAAATATSDPQFDACVKVKDSTDRGQQECAIAAHARADDRLNRQFKRVMAQLEGLKTAAGSDLLSEQRAWIAFNKQACSFYGAPNFGTYQRRFVAERCMTRVISDRAGQLEEISVEVGS